MLVKGNSGFGIELMDELTIRKSAAGDKAKRLQRQIEKQILFEKRDHPDHIRTPKVLRTSDNGNTFYADMEFVVAEDFVQFLAEADRRALDDFCSVAVEFITRNVASCREAEVSAEIRAKLDDLRERGVPAIYTEAARKRCTGPVSVPVGSCHGDLTLSNILFRGRTLYLIDFLDCYVETPLQDVAKLRQDTCFFWSLELYQAEFNWPRIQIALRYLDGRIDEAFGSYDWYRRHYELFQFINLMRLLPYCVETKTSNLVTRALDDVLGKFTRGPA